MKQEIAFKYENGIIIENTTECSNNNPHAMSFIEEMNHLGFMPDSELIDALMCSSNETVIELYQTIIPILKHSIGDNVNHNPMYPNFPNDVMSMEDNDLYLIAILHYGSEGKWKPEFIQLERNIDLETIEFKTLTLVKSIDHIFDNLVKSNDSISTTDKKIINWFIETNPDIIIPEDITFKEISAQIAGELLKQDKWNDSLISDTTDILRVATYINDGDISLASNTKFKSLSRKKRRILINSLSKVAKEEDFVRHSSKWVKLFHGLHVGDFSASLYDIAKKLRENIKIETFNSNVEFAFKNENYDELIRLLSTRPSEFARRILSILSPRVNDIVPEENAFSKLASLRTINEPNVDGELIIEKFFTVVDQVPTKVLLQLLGSLKSRHNDVAERLVFPKGSIANGYIIQKHLPKLEHYIIDDLMGVITDSLVSRFGEQEIIKANSKVWIDPNLITSPLPTGMRSSSEALKVLARGTRIPTNFKKSIRLFVHWIGRDIDLACSFFNENFEMLYETSYNQLKNDSLDSYHSGDITDAPAPMGASEFVDFSITSALNKNIRYVAMNLFIYSGPKSFKEHETCFVGWMNRDKINSNEIFEPNTVENKIDIVSDASTAMPVVFDLVKNEIIYLDVSVSNNNYVNNVSSNKAAMSDILKGFCESTNKVSLYELFTFHAIANNCDIVDSRIDADITFAFDGDVTPYNIDIINSEYIK